jgi:hypothetical protein
MLFIAGLWDPYKTLKYTACRTYNFLTLNLVVYKITTGRYRLTRTIKACGEVDYSPHILNLRGRWTLMWASRPGRLFSAEWKVLCLLNLRLLLSRSWPGRCAESASVLLQPGTQPRPVHIGPTLLSLLTELSRLPKEVEAKNQRGFFFLKKYHFSPLRWSRLFPRNTLSVDSFFYLTALHTQCSW